MRSSLDRLIEPPTSSFQYRLIIRVSWHRGRWTNFPDIDQPPLGPVRKHPHDSLQPLAERRETWAASTPARRQLVQSYVHIFEAHRHLSTRA